MIPIIFSSDNVYAQHTGVALSSVALNTRDPSELRFYIIDCGISADNLGKLRATAAAHDAELEVFKPDLWLFRDLPLERFGVAAWARLLTPELIPDQRAIYLDGDIIVEADISELWTTDLRNHLVGAVANGSNSSEERLEVQSSDYFNSGVMLMNLRAWRERRFTEQLVAYAAAHRERLGYPDQDTLNACLRGNWLRLPGRWNALSRVFDPGLIERIVRETGCSHDEVEQARSYPAIIHYASQRRRKPWMHRSFHPLAHRYWHYLAKTPWADYRAPDAGLLGKLQRARRYKDARRQAALRTEIAAVNPRLAAT